jgi:DNA-directed RNA polymerase subunit RPC12/RpoP
MSDTFTTIARFQYTTEAQIIKGRLEADGIKVFLKDHLTIDTDPLVSNAIGGVKLQVLAKDAMEAKHILSTINQYSLDDDGNQIECPNCSSGKIELFSTITDFKSFFAFLVGFMFGTLPFHTRYKYTCEACNTQFSKEDIKPNNNNA